MPDDDAPAQPTVTSIPITTGSDGRAYVGCDAVIALLRSLAHVITSDDDPEPFDAEAIAEYLSREADALTCRAITHTDPESHRPPSPEPEGERQT